MKSAKLLSVIVLLAALVACGGGDDSQDNNNTSRVKSRAFVSNSYLTTGVQIIDYNTDRDTFFSITQGLLGFYDARQMALSGDRSKTLLLSREGRSLTLLDNRQESVLQDSLPLTDVADAIAINQDGSAVYGSVRNSEVEAGTPGAVEYYTISSTEIKRDRFVVPLVRNIVLSGDGKTLLAFGEQSNSVYVIDTAGKTTKTVAGFDRPVNAIFTSDNSKAYILSCGRECGGNQASVAVLDIASATASAPVNLPAATVGLLDGNTLYVAGSTTTGGVLSTVSVGTTLSLSGNPIQIGDGFHRNIVRAAGGKLFIGARACSSGCLSMVNTGNGQAVVGGAKGDVTGMAAIPTRNVVYVAEGGELRIYDTTTNAESTTSSINLTGNAYDVKVID